MSKHHKDHAYGFRIYADEEMADFPGIKKNVLKYSFYINPPDYRVLSFKGGGSRVIVYSKFLETVHEQGLLHNIEEVGGSSSGSVAAAFAAIHYTDASRRTASLDAISRVDKDDIYSNKIGWKIYRFLTSPLYVISKPFEWVGYGIGWLANQCNKILPGKLIGYPLKAISLILKSVAILTSPRSYAGLANLIVKGGVYQGDAFQNLMRDRFQSDSQAGLNALLEKMEDTTRAATLQRLMDIGLCYWQLGELKVVADITFNHLYELTLLPKSQFKELYITGLRISDKALVDFNRRNDPNMPIHLAARLAINFPLYFQPRTYLGERYIDGGTADNAPVNRATHKTVSPFLSQFGMTDEMARLNVRVEYPDELATHLWQETPKASKFWKFFEVIKRAIIKRFTVGVDFFEKDDEVTKIMQERYAQRTLQLPDFGISVMKRNIRTTTRNRINETIPILITDFFANHHDEKIVIHQFPQPEEAESDFERLLDNTIQMPLDVRMKLIKHLQDANIPSEEIFSIPQKNKQELDEIRAKELQRLMQMPSTIEYLQSAEHQQRKNYKTLPLVNSTHILQKLGATTTKPLALNETEKVEINLQPLINLPSSQNDEDLLATNAVERPGL
jgi:predicted acylesterase/phospholipase RssA